MPLVAVDSNVIDLFLDCMPTDGHVDASEAQESPPVFEGDDPRRRRELLVRFWLRTLAASWPSTLYTFSDMLYAEVRLALRHLSFLGLRSKLGRTTPRNTAWPISTCGRRLRS